MPLLKLDLDAETHKRLVERALAHRRPVDWQAEVELRRALGLPFPYATASADSTDQPATSDAEPIRS